VQEGQLHGVGDLLDLIVEATDVGVADVGHLLEHELLDLGTGQAFQDQAGATVDQDVVAGAQRCPDEVLGQFGHALLVGSPDHQGAATSRHDLLQGRHLAGDLVVAGHDHVERLVEHHLAAALQGVGLEAGHAPTPGSCDPRRRRPRCRRRCGPAVP
jgi:hypothetical protein